MKAGKYWVGDLCYVLQDRWEEVCSLTIKDNVCLEGEFELEDGTEFAMYRTAWGDGEYTDMDGYRYPVDSGSIGCVLVDSIAGIEPLDTSLGNVFHFDESFNTSGESGLITIGSVEIDTIGELEDTEDVW